MCLLPPQDTHTHPQYLFQQVPFLFHRYPLSPFHVTGVMEFGGTGSYPTPSQGITLIQSPTQQSGLTLIQTPPTQPQGLTIIPTPNQVGGLSLVQTPTQQSPLDQQVISQDFSFNTIQEQQPDHQQGGSEYLTR